MSEFRFKRFTVRNELSAMKVNTDGVLLGAAMTLLPKDRWLLDVGTGTGTIALMAAQRLSGMVNDNLPHRVLDDHDSRTIIGNGHSGLDSESCYFQIIGIDIDKASADEAALNFAASPWTSGLCSVNKSLADYAFMTADGVRRTEFRPDFHFDVMFSNPPYFESSLKAPDERRRNARHADSLSYRDIFAAAGIWLKNTGRLSLILPAEQEREVVRNAAAAGFYPFRMVRVRTVPRKAPSRVILEFSRRRQETAEELLTIQDEGTYTEQYRSLVKDFLFV